MFEVSQLAQGSITSRQISQASARLTENARDPKVAALIRLRDDQSAKLSDLYESRDDLKSGPQTKDSAAADADLAKRIAALQQEQAKTEADLQAASPNYGQLVQQVVATADLFRVLHPGEAFVATPLSRDAGWVFLLRDGKIRVAPIGAGSADLAAWWSACAKALTRSASRRRRSISKRHKNSTTWYSAASRTGSRMPRRCPWRRRARCFRCRSAFCSAGRRSRIISRGAPWLIRDVTIEHVPAPANFLSPAQAGGNVARDPPLVRFRRFPTRHAGPGGNQFSGAFLRRYRLAAGRACRHCPARAWNWRRYGA